MKVWHSCIVTAAHLNSPNSSPNACHVREQASCGSCQKESMFVTASGLAACKPPGEVAETPEDVPESPYSASGMLL